MRFPAMLIVFLVMTVVLLPPAAAAPRTERTPAMREPVYRQLSAARERADAEQYTEALEILGRLTRQSGLNGYEKAMAWNLYAFVHYSQDNPRQAIEAYRKVLAQDALPLSLETNTLYSLAQMHLVMEDYRTALDTLLRWFELVESPGANAKILLGQIHYQLDDYKAARQPIREAVAELESRNEQVRENWYLLLRAIYYSDKDYAGLSDVLESLVRHYPKREYWVQLSAVYGELGHEKKQLAALETAYEQGLLIKEADLLMFSQLLLAHGIPYKAGVVMQKGMADHIVEPSPEHLRLLADAWILSKEFDKGVVALKRAAAAAPDGELSLRLAQVRLEMGDYAEALAAARTAIERGDRAESASAHIVAGLALYNLEQFADSISAFRQAAGYEETRVLAEQWLEYVQHEQKRRLQLQAALTTGLKTAARAP